MSVSLPITGLGRCIAPGDVADALFLRGLLSRRNVGAAHRRVAPFVRAVVLAVSHNIFSALGVVLHERDGANAIDTGCECYDHRSSLSIAHHSRAKLIPATHSTTLRNAFVIGWPEIDLPARSFGDALSVRRAAVRGKRRWVEDSVGNFLALFSRRNGHPYLLCRKLYPNVGLARLHSVPFSIADETPTRKDATVVEFVIILNDSPPPHGEWRGRDR